MNGNLSHALGFILGVTLITGIIVAMLMFFTSRDKKLKRKYDERQELIRGKAFKYAFYTVITMNMIYSVADISFDRIPVDPSVAGFIMAS